MIILILNALISQTFQFNPDIISPTFNIEVTYLYQMRILYIFFYIILLTLTIVPKRIIVYSFIDTTIYHYLDLSLTHLQ